MTYRARRYRHWSEGCCSRRFCGRRGERARVLHLPGTTGVIGGRAAAELEHTERARVHTVLVTDPEGRLLGLVDRTSGEQALKQGHAVAA